MVTVQYGMHLLPREALLKTGDVDHADWNFRPFLGAIIRKRYRLLLALLRGQRYQRLCEIGYGSGVFLPELSRYCQELYGIDVHSRQAEVQDTLTRAGVGARLFSGSMTALPFADRFFGCLVAVSVLEFVDDLETACREARRVLQPGGLFVVVTPGICRLADFGLKVLTGKSADRDFADRRQAVIPTLLRHFTLQQRLTVPRIGTSLVHLYTALQLRA